MRRKWFNMWLKCNKECFTGYLSNGIECEGDSSLPKGTPMRKWKQAVILVAQGEIGTKYRIGFTNSSGISKMSNCIRKIGDGSFGMRIGKEDCIFFLVNVGEEPKRILLTQIRICPDIKKDNSGQIILF